MTAPPQMAPPQIGPPILQGGTTQEDPALGINAGLRAIRIAFENIASEKSAQEAKDWAMAALNVAQAIVVLSPSVSQGGTPLEHDMAMKGLEGETQQAVAAIHGQTQIAVEAQRGENARRQANEAAQAPTPARGKVASP
jgi:hypothetical protein